MKLTKTSAAALSASLLFVAASASAADEAFSTAGSVAMTSDYLYRGISQTRVKPAVQGGVDFSAGGRERTGGFDADAGRRPRDDDALAAQIDARQHVTGRRPEAKRCPDEHRGHHRVGSVLRL